MTIISIILNLKKKIMLLSFKQFIVNLKFVIHLFVEKNVFFYMLNRSYIFWNHYEKF